MYSKYRSSACKALMALLNWRDFFPVYISFSCLNPLDFVCPGVRLDSSVVLLHLEPLYSSLAFGPSASGNGCLIPFLFLAVFTFHNFFVLVGMCLLSAFFVVFARLLDFLDEPLEFCMSQVVLQVVHLTIFPSFNLLCTPVYSQSLE